MITGKLWRIYPQDGTFLLVFHDVMVSTFRFGGNRRFFGVDTAAFVWCRGGTQAIRLPVVCDIPVSDVTKADYPVTPTVKFRLDDQETRPMPRLIKDRKARGLATPSIAGSKWRWVPVKEETDWSFVHISPS